MPSRGPGWYKTRLVYAEAALPSRPEDPAHVARLSGHRQAPHEGNTVSHANNRTRRRFLPNLHRSVSGSSGEKRWISLRVSTNALRTIEKNGIDAVVAELRARGEKHLMGSRAMREKVKLLSSANTGHFYVAMKNSVFILRRWT